MNKKIFLIAPIIILTLTACSFRIMGQAQEAVPAPTDLPAHTPSAVGLAYGNDAIVSEILLKPNANWPREIVVFIRGNLPDGCTKTDSVTYQFIDNLFKIEIRTRRPVETACAQGLVPFEQELTIDTAELLTGTYRVNAQGAEAEFYLESSLEAPLTGG